MKKVASVFILLLASTFVNAGILLDTGTPNSESSQCVANGCNGTGEWWAVSYFTTDSEDWDITGFEFFGTGADQSNYLSTSWQIFSAPFSASDSVALFSGSSQASVTDTIVNNINVNSFLLDDIDITLEAGQYYLAQHHVYSEDTVLTVLKTTGAGRWYNTDFDYSFKKNSQVAQKIYGATAAVPEPALMALLGLGLLSLGFSRKNKKV